MVVGSILSTGIQAMQAGINRAHAAGGQIATKGVEDENLAKNLIGLKQSELDVKAAANIIKTGDEMLGTIIDIRA
jgi:hypothetical protein